MKHKCKPGSPALILMKGHHATGGEIMSRDMGGEIAPRRVAPNMEQRFKKGGHCVEYDREEHLERSSRKKNGISSKRKHHGMGGDIIGGVLSHLANLIPFKEGGIARLLGGSAGSADPDSRAYIQNKAMGGVAKTRKNYPMT